jgi:hypothetical protein
MAALVSPWIPEGLLVGVGVAEGRPPLVRQVRLLLEAMVVLAPSSPSQAPPPHIQGAEAVVGG